MQRPELANTLVDLVTAIEPPPGSGLAVTGAELDVPLEVVPAVRDGRLVILASPPHSRWRSGFLPQVHGARLVIASAPSGASPFRITWSSTPCVSFARPASEPTTLPSL